MRCRKVSVVMSQSSSFLTLVEVAEISRAPLQSVRHWIAEGRLASIRPGRLRLVRRVDLAKFLGVEIGDLSQ